MEPGQHEDSKTSSEESTDQQEQANDDADTSRSYVCVFCKRGFTTAQALGGHMNIHRRDRAKTKQIEAPSASTVPYCSPISSHPPSYSPTPEARGSYHSYIPQSTSSPGYRHAYHANDPYIQRPQPFQEDWSTALSLQIGPTQIEQRQRQKKQKEEEEDQLDLELRLGHDPY